MQTPKLTAALALAALTPGCATDDDVASSDQRYSVVDSYDQEFGWDTPPCAVYLDTRTTDEEARVVEYVAELAGQRLALVYRLVAEEPLPMRAEVFDHDGQRLVGAAFDATDLTIDGSDGSRLEVRGFTGFESETQVSGSLTVRSSEAVALLGCALPVRPTLGAVPAFLHNRDGGRLPDEPDVGQGSEDRPPLVTWNGRTSILGGVLLLAACGNPWGWRCPCLAWSDPIAGEVPGWCPTAAP